MFTTYLNTANSSTGGAALDTTGKNVVIKRLIIGNPVTSANIWLYDENNVGNVTNTTGLKAKLTLPASFATGQLPFTIALDTSYGAGLLLAMGGSVAIDQAIQLTVVWDYAQEPDNQV